MPKQPVRVADQRVDQPLAGLAIVPGDRGFTRVVVVVGAALCSAITSAAPGTSRRTRRIAPINWVTVSWVATASSSTVESSARRVLPASAPVSATTALTASKIRFGDPRPPTGAASTSTSSHETPPRVTANPHAVFHRRSKVTASTVSLSDSPCNACSVITAAITSAGTLGRPRPVGNKSANISSGNNSRRCAARNANTLPAFRR